ncbi:hypothetical protein G3A39_43165 [Paraburkholderia aspalathi]|nr:hypothetical protein [Paraburkholderia aspalathi]
MNSYAVFVMALAALAIFKAVESWSPVPLFICAALAFIAKPFLPPD